LQKPRWRPFAWKRHPELQHALESVLTPTRLRQAFCCRWAHSPALLPLKPQRRFGMDLALLRSDARRAFRDLLVFAVELTAMLSLEGLDSLLCFIRGIERAE